MNVPREAKVIHEHYEKVVEHLLAEGYIYG